ncbi:MAG: class I tRNA ligase family protein [Patescibacteria group bacterium]|nr:class I tRNA ligase family protein [Patescibacteria group bacterium]MCL5261792.1 class I tRNA ligase family protein [Patescibacteria group bacterium]
MFKGEKSLNLPEVEKKVLDFWQSDRIFEKSLERRKSKKPFRFYEGPPYANGKPGIHHVLARVFKDIVLRYKAMGGFYVPRRAGWDTHGLPAEIATEKELGIKDKKEIEEYGIDKFNAKAKEGVMKYQREFELMTERIGYWLDLKDAYITYTNSYIAGLWKVFKKISNRGFLKRDYKILPWCPRCETPLASHELAQPGAYKLVKDPSLYVKFKLKDEDNAYLLVWTTTPWTLPANMLVAVNPNFTYSKYEVNGEYLWSKITPPEIQGEAKIAETASGKELAGRKYIPLFGGDREDVFKVVAADFVSDEEGTGLVHIAPAFGEDDLKLAKQIGLKKFPTTVDDEGRVVEGFPGSGKFIKEADSEIVGDLEKRGLVYRYGSAEHEYPHCWRCGTPLIYLARFSWFFEVSRLRKKLVEENEKVNWIPEYIKEGRFGEWIKEAKDWAISRERYWGTPIPVWKCDKCEHEEVVGGLGDLVALSKQPSNRYFVLRHGESQSNVLNIASGAPEKFDNPLTDGGRRDIERLLPRLKKEKIDFVFSSPMKRAQETAEIVSKGLGIDPKYDDRLTEYRLGVMNGEPAEKFEAFFADQQEKFSKAPEGAETLADIRARMMNFVQELNKNYSEKNILIVGHGDPLWALEAAAQGWDEKQTAGAKAELYLKPGELRQIKVLNLPYDRTGKLDLHKPYIDEFKLLCPECGAGMTRTKEVVDVWFDSGAMPFAGGYYPKYYPADFICEAVDQTRGWFYTLLTVSVLLGERGPYQNVICLGLVLDKNGLKMSKSKGNIVDPWSMMDKYGVDPIRWYFYTVNDPGDPKRFDEADLTKALRQFFFIIFNVFSFYELYADKSAELKGKPKSALDRWILARLYETEKAVSGNLNAYNVGSAGREIEKLVEDLSRWYLRRSRGRFQRPESDKDFKEASATLLECLKVLSQMLAPFTPFFGEALYLSLPLKSKAASVHLTDWPRLPKAWADPKLVGLMAGARDLVVAALAERNVKSIKVRQPLQTLKFSDKNLQNAEALLELVKDEVNVKEAVFDGNLEAAVWLDNKITAELRAEGLAREFTRMVQDLRQKAGLKPGEEIELFAVIDAESENILIGQTKELKSKLFARRIEFKKPSSFLAENEDRLGDKPVWLGLNRIGS